MEAFVQSAGSQLRPSSCACARARDLRSDAQVYHTYFSALNYESLYWIETSFICEEILPAR
jgi:hypothetical protein